MIETFLKSGTLDTPAAFLASLFIGIAFGIALEKAGFGSSRRLAGIFYFRDMTVLKVMFTAVVVAMLGICYARAFGFVTLENVYFLHTVYAAQIVGGGGDFWRGLRHERLVPRNGRRGAGVGED